MQVRISLFRFRLLYFVFLIGIFTGNRQVLNVYKAVKINANARVIYSWHKIHKIRKYDHQSCTRHFYCDLSPSTQALIKKDDQGGGIAGLGKLGSHRLFLHFLFSHISIS